MRSHRLLGLVTSTVLLSFVVPVSLSPSFRESAALAQEAGEGDRKAEADALFNGSIQFWQRGDYQQALSMLQQALEIYREIGDRRGEGATLTGIGAVYRNLGQYSQALDYYQQALEINIETGDRQGEGTTLNNIGVVYDSLGQYQQALDYYQQALAIRTDIGDRRGEGVTLNNIGAVYDNLGQYQQALDYYQQALAITTVIGDRSDEGNILDNIGQVYHNLGQYQQALDYYQQALAIRTDIGDRRGEGTTLNNIGGVYDSLGQYQQALDYLQRALAISIDIGDRSGEGTTLNNIGGVYDSLGQYQQALDYYQQALAIRTDIGDRRGERVTLSNIGEVYRNLGQYQQALGYFQRALAISIDIGDRAGKGIALNSIGAVSGNLGQYQQALDYFQRALAISIDIGDRSGEGTTLNNIGGVYDSLGQYQQALDYYQQALAIRTEVGDRRGEGRTLNNIGLVYRKLGEYQQALNHYQQALAIRTEVGDRSGEGVTLNNIGVVYDSLGQYQQALDYYQQALAIRTDIGDRAGEGTTFNNIGAVYRDLGQYQQALDYYQQALAITTVIGDRRGEGRTLNNIGLVYDSLGEYQQALDYYQQALVIITDIGDRAGEGATLNNIGYTLESLGQSELAIVFLKESVNQWEEIRGDIRGLSIEQQQSFADSISSSYRRLADLLLQADRVLEAQRVLDLLKVQELDEYLQDVQRSAQTEDGVPLSNPEVQIQERQQAITNRAVAIGEELAQLRQIEPENRTPEQMARITELEAMQAEVIAEFEDFIYSDEIQALVAQLTRETRPQDLVNELDELITIQDNLRALEQNAVLLYPLILDDRIELVLVTPNSPPARYPINVSRSELNAAIVEFRQALETPTSNPEAIAQQLYNWLIQPLASDLEAINAETIIYAPDGVLRYVPLAALHDGDRWLAERFRVNHITAASLTNLNLQPAAQPDILAAAFSEGSVEFQVGDRNFAFDGLPYAGQEVENLVAAFPGTTKLMDEDFSPTATVGIMDDHTIVHLATHAEFVQGTPAESFIVFGNGDRVTLEEIKQWRGRFRQIDLIVLSACETGLGESLGNGEEILGFGYLMQRAGARAAIASLWAVSDGGTQNLMDAFYTAILNGYSKTEALQRAQVALIRNDASVLEPSQRGIQLESTETGEPLEIQSRSLQGRLGHPYYWAPFILIGNGL
ncbi:MAG: CHAT domain-containing protein [Elainellaceae cyanobacterium]